MKTLRCTIKLPDGAILAARAASNSPQADVSIEFSGAIDRLGVLAEKGTMEFLEWFLRERAVQLCASLEIATEGHYDFATTEGVATHQER